MSGTFTQQTVAKMVSELIWFFLLYSIYLAQWICDESAAKIINTKRMKSAEGEWIEYVFIAQIFVRDIKLGDK